jgi:hypothetical protein
MNFSKHYFTEDAKAFANEVKLLIEQDDVASVSINPMFVSRLCNYLEKRFPNYGDFDIAVGNEIRQHMQGDNSYVKKVKQRIHDIINKSKSKFLRDIHNKVDKIKILPKQEPAPPIVNYDPLMSDEPIAGDSLPNVQ